MRPPPPLPGGFAAGNNRAATLISPRGELLQIDAEGGAVKVRGDAVLLRVFAPANTRNRLEGCSLVDVTGQDFEDGFGVYGEVRIRNGQCASWIVPNTPEGIDESTEIMKVILERSSIECK